MAVNPLLVGAGAIAAWLLTRGSSTDTGSGVPSGGGGPPGGAGTVDPAKAAAIQAQLTVINAGLATGTIKQAKVKGLIPMATPANVIAVGLPASTAVAVTKGIANAVVAINAASLIGSPGWTPRIASKGGSTYTTIRYAANDFVDDVLSRMAAMAPAICDENGNPVGGISYFSVSTRIGIDPVNGTAYNPLSGFGAFAAACAEQSRGGGEVQFKTVGVDPASLLKIVLASIYSAIEEAWAYNAAWRKFLTFYYIMNVGTDPRQWQADLDKYSQSEEVFWGFINGTLLQSRILAGEDWNAGVDLKYGDSGVNLHELGYGWLENWAPSTLGATGARALIASSHASGAARAIAQAAKMGYSTYWPGDAAFTTAINLNTVNWDSVNTTMIRDPASGLAVDVVKSREQNKVVAYVPT